MCNNLTETVAHLDRAGLVALIAMAETRLADLGSNGHDEHDDDLLPKSQDADSSKSRKGGSWVELKMIPNNGKLYGPYAYKRWREGGRCRSQYIGKVQETQP